MLETSTLTEDEVRRIVHEELERAEKKDQARKKAAIIASQGTLDMAYPPLILASTAAATGMETHVFFTFYGLNIIHKDFERTWKEGERPTEQLPLVDVDELRASLPDSVVVDAREPFEHRHARIPGSLLFPPADAWHRARELPEGRLAVVCGDQTRSAFVASILAREGREAVLVMGGMVDWLERGYPTEKRAAASA